MVMALAAFMLRRLLGNGVLTFSIALGFVLTVTLVTAIPLYSEGISEFVLRQDLRSTGSRLASGVVVRHADVRTAGQPPTSREEYLEADAFFARLGDFVGLPERNRVHYLQSNRVALLDLAQPTDQPVRDADVVYGFLAAMTGIEANVVMLEGRAPSPEVGTLRDVSGQDVPLIEAMLTSQSLDDAGLLVGDRVKALHTDSYTNETTLLAIDIVGRFVPADPDSTFWYQNIYALSRGPVFIHPQVFRDDLLVRYPTLFRQATWYSDFDPDAIRTDNYAAVGAALSRLRASADTILPDTRVASRLASILAAFGERLFFLKLLLFVLAAPILAIVLYFMRLSAGMAVERQRGEIAILKSRRWYASDRGRLRPGGTSDRRLRHAAGPAAGPGPGPSDRQDPQLSGLHRPGSLADASQPHALRARRRGDCDLHRHNRRAGHRRRPTFDRRFQAGRIPCPAPPPLSTHVP